MMFSHVSFLTAFLISFCNAAIFSSTPTAVGTLWNAENVALQPTEAPNLRDARGLLLKRDSPDWLCGSGTAIGSITCSHTRSCAGKVFSNGQAYQYCSDPNLVNQDVATVVHANWPSNETCPNSAQCCVSPYSAPITWLYIDSGYTMTGFSCTDSSTSFTVIPATNLLDPSAFSISLAEARGRTTSATTSSPTSTTTHDSGSSDGMSTGTKIGVGAGVGIGVGALLVAGGAYLFGRHQRKKKQQKPAPAQSPTQGPPYDMRSSYGQPPEYGNVAYKNYHDLSRNYQGADYDILPSSSPQPQELSGWSRPPPQELPGSPGSGRQHAL